VAGAPVHVIDVSVHGRTYDAGWEHGVRREARTTYGAIRLPPPEADATMLHVRLWWGGYQPPHSRPPRASPPDSRISADAASIRSGWGGHRSGGGEVFVEADGCGLLGSLRCVSEIA
jgi:hypothetical protein